MYKQLNHSNQEAAYLLGSILLFSFQGCKEKPVTSLNLSSTPNVIYVFPDQMRNHAMGFWREAGFREAVNFEGDPVHTPNLDRFAKESVVLPSAMMTLVPSLMLFSLVRHIYSAFKIDNGVV